MPPEKAREELSPITSSREGHKLHYSRNEHQWENCWVLLWHSQLGRDIGEVERVQERARRLRQGTGNPPWPNPLSILGQGVMSLPHATSALSPAANSGHSEGWVEAPLKLGVPTAATFTHSALPK